MTLKQIREAFELSQSGLDKRARLPRGTVRAIEDGRNANPTVEVAGAIVAALKREGATGLTVDSLFVAERLQVVP